MNPCALLDITFYYGKSPLLELGIRMEQDSNHFESECSARFYYNLFPILLLFYAIFMETESRGLNLMQFMGNYYDFSKMLILLFLLSFNGLTETT